MIHDARLALRLLARDKGFAFTALIVLGLGLGVNNMMFTLLYSLTMRGLPIERAERVLYISTFDQRFPDRPLSYPEVQDLEDGNTTFTGIAAFVNAPVAVADHGRAPDRFDAAYVSANAFRLIGTAPAIGRAFAPDDDRSGAAPVVILGAGAWTSRYGSDATVIGRTILVDGAPATVIGVMPQPSGFPSTAEVWLPLAGAPGLARERREARRLQVFGRVKDEVAISDAQAEITAIIDRGAREHPETSAGLRARTVPINQRFFGSPAQMGWLAFSAAAILVVIVSCANAANLMLARAIRRTTEMAIRHSLGATRTRVVRQLLIESLVLAGLAGLVGLAISLASVRVFEAAVPDQVFPYWMHFRMDGVVFGALAAVSLGAVLVFGLIPAVRASKTDVNQVLKQGGRSLSVAGAERLSTAFLVAQFALSVVLVSQFAVSLRSGGTRLASDAVLESGSLLTAALTLPGEKYRTPEERALLYRRLLDELGGAAGVSAVTIASALPLSGALERRVEVDGHGGAPGETLPTALAVAIAPDYFETLRLPLLGGAGFAQSASSGEDVIVNQRFADVYLRAANPIGSRIRLSGANLPEQSGTWLTVIGVAQNIRQRTTLDPDSIVYTPILATAPANASLIVRVEASLETALSSVRARIMNIDPHLPVYRTRSLQQVAFEAQWNPRVSHRLLSTITLVALVLAVIGLYAVTSHAVGRRRHELGIRLALGARPSALQALVLGRGLVQVGLGLAFGIAGALAWGAVFSSGRIDVRITEPVVLLPVSALLALVTAIACFVPARRAAKTDPASVLREG